MRTVILLALISAVACRPAPPRSAADAPAAGPDLPAAGTDSEPGEGEVDGPGRSAEVPRAARVVADLTGLISAAVTGRDLPETPFGLPGRRGEEVVQVQGDGFPAGAVEATASMVKVDVTLEGCEPGGGLTLGLLQSAAGVHLVGLGDQFTAATGAPPDGFIEIVALARHGLGLLRGDGSGAFVLDDVSCEAVFGSVDRCHRIFQELPGEEDLVRHRQLLSSCDAEPAVVLDVVALWLVDEEGAEYQALARFQLAHGRLSLAAPIMLAPGIP